MAGFMHLPFLIFQHFKPLFHMKKLLLAVFNLCLVVGIAKAQVSIEIHQHETTYNMQTDLADEYSEVVAHAVIENTSAQAIKVRWQLEVPTTDCVSDWKYAVCDKNNCYSFGTVSNINPGSNPNVTVDLAPGDSSIIDLHIRPTLVAGCCSPTIRFSEITSLSNPIDLGSAGYEVCISQLSSTNEPGSGLNIEVYPNPTTGQFNITDNPLVKEIAVYNTMGQKMCQYPHANGKAHDISHVANGLYFVNLLDENGQPLKTVRMTKEGNR
jgi:hypothetical protein